MGQYDITGKYPCIVKREGQLEYARYNYENRIIILRELATLCRFHFDHSCFIQRIIVTIICEIAIIAKQCNDMELRTRLDGLAGLANSSISDRVRQEVEYRIRKVLAYLEGRSPEEVPMPEMPTLLVYPWSITIEDINRSQAYPHRRIIMSELKRLVCSPIPYYHFRNGAHNMLSLIHDFSPNGESRQCLKNAIDSLKDWRIVTEEDFRQLDLSLERAIELSPEEEILP